MRQMRYVLVRRTYLSLYTTFHLNFTNIQQMITHFRYWKLPYANDFTRVFIFIDKRRTSWKAQKLRFERMRINMRDRLFAGVIALKWENSIFEYRHNFISESFFVSVFRAHLFSLSVAIAREIVDYNINDAVMPWMVVGQRKSVERTNEMEMLKRWRYYIRSSQASIYTYIDCYVTLSFSDFFSFSWTKIKVKYNQRKEERRVIVSHVFHSNCSI